MITLNNKTLQMDDLLDKMAEELQLDDTRYDRMNGHYQAVKKWIEEDEIFFKPFKYDLYPHGSVRTLTTVKPIGRDEFDLDVALHLKTQWADHTPAKVYAELKRRLEEHEVYKKLIVLKNRCIRLNYAGDFHMDILPGIQENEWNQDELRVPDRSLGTWVSSNPKGFAKWFIAKANTMKISLLEKSLRAENLPADNFEHKKPLQRGVQLIKRYRDVYFQKDDTYKTSSIILTTLAGHLYNGEDSIFDTVDNIITKIRLEIASSSSRIKVLNPVNPKEDFTDKWESEPEHYTAFKKFCDHLYAEWQKLKEENGIISEGNILKGLFGNDLYVKSQTRQADIIEKARQTKDLGIERKSGLITGAGIAGASTVRKNTFYGK